MANLILHERVMKLETTALQSQLTAAAAADKVIAQPAEQATA